MSKFPAPKAHDWRIAQREYDRQEARRGRRHAFLHLDPTKTALLVVDMVPFFAQENPYFHGVVPNIARIASALRKRAGVIAWVLPNTDGEPTAVKREFLGDEIALMFHKSGGTGDLKSRVWAELNPHGDDVFVEKRDASAFFPGLCDLHERLTERDINTVIVTGTVTNVCCEGTARDASARDYRVIMAADANAGNNDESHNATLTTIYRTFGDVRSTDEILELINASER